MNEYRILVVDDEEDLCEILKFNLENEGYEVDTANSAEDALKMDISTYDLLLLDVMMGEISGFKMASMTFEIAPSLSWTLFNGTKLVNATRLARAQLDESIHQFNQTVLTAVQETDNAMNGYRNSIKQIVALREVCNQGEETLKLSLDLYKQGLTPFQNVLDALRSLLAYQNQLTQAQGNSLQELISLYKALGGGYGNIISGL